MIQLPRNEDVQNIISVTFSENQSANTEITIKETQSGEEIVSHMPAKDFRTFIFSSDKIEVGTEYTVYAGGKAYETVTAAQGITHIGSDMSAGFPGGGRGGFDRDNSVRDNSNKNISDNKQESKIKVVVDGKNIQFDSNPIIKDGTTLVGFRGILEALGASVSWDEETKTVTAEKNGVNIVLKIGSTSAMVNKEQKTMLLAPEIIDNSTMIPIRFISEQLGMNVSWDGETQLITVSSK